MDSGPNITIFGLEMMVKSGLVFFSNPSMRDPKTRNSVIIVNTFCFLQNKKQTQIILQKLDQTPKYTIQVKPVEWRWILEIKFYQTYLYLLLFLS